MTPKKTPFLMAAIVAIICLIWAQIAAPPHLKPLTSHILNYPGTGLPALTLDRGIFRMTRPNLCTSSAQAPEKCLQIRSILGGPQLPKIAMVSEDKGGGSIKKQTKDKKDKGSKEDQIKITTPTNIIDQTRQDTYTAQYGDEAARYNYNYDTGKAATTAEWVNPEAEIAGTYVAPDGKRYNIGGSGGVDTAKAAGELADAVATKLTTLSDQQVLDIAKTTCPPTDSTCQQTLIKNTIVAVAEQSLAVGTIDKASIENIAETQRLNAASQAELNTKLSPFLDPTQNPLSFRAKEQGQTLEDYLRGIGITDPNDLKNLITTRNTNVANYQKDLELVKKYADPSVTTSDLAKSACGDDYGCVKNFERTDALNSLTFSELATSAKTNYQANLIELTQIIGTSNFNALPDATRNTIINTNADVTHALFVYLYENKVSAEQFDKKALEFGQKIKDNPTIFQEYLAKFNADKTTYESAINVTQVFNLTANDKNPVVVAQLKESIKNTPIEGLSNTNGLLPWDQVSATYKQQARDLTCQSSDALYEACSFNELNDGSPDPIKQQQIAINNQKIDTTIKIDPKSYLQQIFDQQTGANIRLSTVFSNTATINNPLVDQKLKQEAIAYSVLNTTSNPNVGSRGRGPVSEKIDLNQLSQNTTDLANQYLDRQLVTETYKVGGGVIAGMAGFSAGMFVGGAACVATGIGIAVSPICALIGGAVGGISGALAAQVPIYEMTATEYQQQRGGDDLAHSIFQSLYSNQGAWSDEGMGRSITTRNNQFALYSAINTATDGLTVDQINSSPELQTRLAIQGQILNQWEVNQNRQESWTYASLPIAAVTGALNVSVGSQLASSFTGRAILESSFKTLNAASQVPAFLGSMALNQAQTALQFETTGGDASLLTTPEQVDYQVCVMSKGGDNCTPEQSAMTNSVVANRTSAMEQAFVTDALMQGFQTGSGFFGAKTQYQAQIDQAIALKIPTEGRTLSQITLDTNLMIRNATPPKGTAPQADLIPIPDTTNIRNTIASNEIGAFLLSDKVILTEANGKPRLDFSSTHTPSTQELNILNHLNTQLSVMENVSGFETIRSKQLEGVGLGEQKLAAQEVAKNANSEPLLVDLSIKLGINPNARTGEGKNTVILPLLEKIAIDSGTLTLHLAPEANMAGNRQTIENLRSFYDTDVYVAVNEKNASGVVTSRYFTDLSGNHISTDVVLARIKADGTAPMILSDADTAMFALNDVVSSERGLTQENSMTEVWSEIWNNKPTITADEIGTLSGNWQNNLGDPVALSKLKNSEAALYLKDGQEVLSIYKATGELEIIQKARSGELVLEKNIANQSLKPLPDAEKSQIIDIAIDQAHSDKKAPKALITELERIQSLSNIGEKRQAFDTLRKLTPLELDAIYGKNSGHAIAIANAYNDAIYSRLSIIAGIAGNDYRDVSGPNGITIELANSKTISGQQYSEAMLKLALQDEGARRLNISETSLVPLDDLSINTRSIAVGLEDMMTRAGKMIGYDATDRLATAKTGLEAIFDSTPLHKPKSVTLTQSLDETAVSTARLARTEFNDNKTALVIETNVDSYKLDDATSAHTAATLKNIKPGETLYLALADGDGTYKLYKINGADKSNWDLITNTPKSAEELYAVSHSTIGTDPNNKLLAIFENKTRGENFKPSNSLATDIRSAIVIGNPETSISDTIQQSAGRVRTSPGANPDYHFVAYTANADIFYQLSQSKNIPGDILSHLEINQARTEGYISLERNIKAINDRQIGNLITDLYTDAQNNAGLRTQLATLENQIKNSGLAFATTPAEAGTASVLHDQYLFTRGRIDNILTIAKKSGVGTDRINSLRTTFNLDSPDLPRTSFEAMLKPNFDTTGLSGYDLALARNISSFENVPETYLTGSPTQPIKSIASSLATRTNPITSLLTTIKSWLASSPATTNQAGAPRADNSLALTASTRTTFTNNQSLIQTGLALMRPMINTPSPAQQALTQAQQNLANLQQLYNADRDVSDTELANAKAQVQQAEFLVKNGYPITIPILNNDTLSDILSRPGSETGFVTTDDVVHEFRNINGQITYSKNGSTPKNVTLLQALSLRPQPGSIQLATSGTQNLDPSTYRLAHATVIPQNVATPTNLGSSLASLLLNRTYGDRIGRGENDVTQELVTPNSPSSLLLRTREWARSVITAMSPSTQPNTSNFSTMNSISTNFSQQSADYEKATSEKNSLTRSMDTSQKVFEQWNEKGATLNRNHPMYQEINSIFGKIFPGGKYTIYISTSDEIDAFTIPRAKSIFITAGLVQKLNEFMASKGKQLDEGHLAFILAHELSHWDEGGTKTRLSETYADTNSFKICSDAGYNTDVLVEAAEFLMYIEKQNAQEQGTLATADEEWQTPGITHPASENRKVLLQTINTDLTVELKGRGVPLTPFNQSVLTSYLTEGEKWTQSVEDREKITSSDGFKQELKKARTLSEITETLISYREYFTTKSAMIFSNSELYPRTLLARALWIELGNSATDSLNGLDFNYQYRANLDIDVSGETTPTYEVGKYSDTPGSGQSSAKVAIINRILAGEISDPLGIILGTSTELKDRYPEMGDINFDKFFLYLTRSVNDWVEGKNSSDHQKHPNITRASAIGLGNFTNDKGLLEMSQFEGTNTESTANRKIILDKLKIALSSHVNREYISRVAIASDMIDRELKKENIHNLVVAKVTSTGSANSSNLAKYWENILFSSIFNESNNKIDLTPDEMLTIAGQHLSLAQGGSRLGSILGNNKRIRILRDALNRSFKGFLGFDYQSSQDVIDKYLAKNLMTIGIPYDYSLDGSSSNGEKLNIQQAAIGAVNTFTRGTNFTSDLEARPEHSLLAHLTDLDQIKRVILSAKGDRNTIIIQILANPLVRNNKEFVNQIIDFGITEKVFTPKELALILSELADPELFLKYRTYCIDEDIPNFYQTWFDTLKELPENKNKDIWTIMTNFVEVGGVIGLEMNNNFKPNFLTLSHIEQELDTKISKNIEPASLLAAELVNQMRLNPDRYSKTEIDAMSSLVTQLITAIAGYRSDINLGKNPESEISLLERAPISSLRDKYLIAILGHINNNKDLRYKIFSLLSTKFYEGFDFNDEDGKLVITIPRPVESLILDPKGGNKLTNLFVVRNNTSLRQGDRFWYEIDNLMKSWNPGLNQVGIPILDLLTQIEKLFAHPGLMRDYLIERVLITSKDQVTRDVLEEAYKLGSDIGKTRGTIGIKLINTELADLKRSDSLSFDAGLAVINHYLTTKSEAKDSLIRWLLNNTDTSDAQIILAESQILGYSFQPNTVSSSLQGAKVEAISEIIRNLKRMDMVNLMKVMLDTEIDSKTTESLVSLFDDFAKQNLKDQLVDKKLGRNYYNFQGWGSESNQLDFNTPDNEFTITDAEFETYYPSMKDYLLSKYESGYVSDGSKDALPPHYKYNLDMQLSNRNKVLQLATPDRLNTILQNMLNNHNVSATDLSTILMGGTNTERRQIVMRMSLGDNGFFVEQNYQQYGRLVLETFLDIATKGTNNSSTWSKSDADNLKTIVLAGFDSLSPERRAEVFYNVIDALINSGGKVSKEQFVKIGLSAFGVVGAKLGQMDSLFPDAIRSSLNELKEDVPEIPKLPVWRVLQKHNRIYQLGVNESDDSIIILGSSLKSGSTAVIYSATRKDGKEVIVKVIRPDVKEHYITDLIAAEKAITALSSLGMVQVDTTQVMNELKQMIAEELDPRNEASNIAHAKEYGSGKVSLTDVYAVSVDDLIISRAPGKSLSDIILEQKAYQISQGHLPFSELSESDKNKLSITSETELANRPTNPYSIIDLNTIYKNIIAEFFDEAFRVGRFHSDLHEGNIFIDETGQVTIIDWGQVGTVEGTNIDTEPDVAKKEALTWYLVGIVTNNPDFVARSLASFKDGLSISQIRAELEIHMQGFVPTEGQDIALAQRIHFLNGVTAITTKYEIRGSIIRFTKALMNVVPYIQNIAKMPNDYQVKYGNNSILNWVLRKTTTNYRSEIYQLKEFAPLITPYLDQNMIFDIQKVYVDPTLNRILDVVPNIKLKTSIYDKVMKYINTKILQPQSPLSPSPTGPALPLPAFAGPSLGVGLSSWAFNALAPYIGPFIPNLPLLTHNVQTWVENRHLIPNYIQNLLGGVELDP